MGLFVELKHNTQCEPFCDVVNGEMEKWDPIHRKSTRGQCLRYATNQLAYQQTLRFQSAERKRVLSVGTEG